MSRKCAFDALLLAFIFSCKIRSAFRAFSGSRKKDPIFKLEGHTSLSPYLSVDDAQAMLQFIKAVFDAEPELIHRADGDAIAHAEIRIDDTSAHGRTV